LILWGAFALPSVDPFEVAPVDALPVDLVPISEFTDLQRGSKTAELRDQPSEADTKPETPPEPQPEPEPVGAQPEPQPTPPTPEPTDVAALPEAAAVEPAPPEPEVEPEPTPAPEPVQQQAPEPEPEPEPEPAQAEPVSPIAKTVVPKTKPTPPKRKPTQTAQQKQRSDDVAALLNKVDPSGGGSRRSSTPASLGTRTGNDNARMTQSELDALRAKIASCWNVPVGALEAENLVIKLGFELNRDGTVAVPPKVLNSSSNPSFRAAADSARRAVLRCQPYTLPAHKYDAWKNVIVNFDPREMLGG